MACLTPFSTRRRSLNSFTLVELLVVMAIAALLAVISVSAFDKINRSMAISSGAQMLNSELNLARQTAVTRNTDVEFRIYQLPDVTDASTGTPVVYRGFQSFLVLGATTNQLTKVGYLPSRAIISSDSTKTPLLKLVPQAASTVGNFPLPTYGTNYKALVFRFSPNGGLEPNALVTSWVATLILASDKVTGSNGTGLPSDFATLQIDPFSGATTVYRP